MFEFQKLKTTQKQSIKSEKTDDVNVNVNKNTHIRPYLAVTAREKKFKKAQSLIAYYMSNEESSCARIKTNLFFFKHI